MKESLAVIWAIGRKDLLLETRNKDIIIAVSAFALLVLMVFTFAIDINQGNAKLIGPGILWAGIAFAGVTGLNRAFAGTPPVASFPTGGANPDSAPTRTLSSKLRVTSGNLTHLLARVGQAPLDHSRVQCSRLGILRRAVE